MADFSQAEIFSEIERQAPLFKVDPLMAKALLVAENTGSGSLAGRTTYRGDAVSPAGARGLMQVMPDTAAGLQKAGFLPADWKHDPADKASQVQAGLAAIKEKMSRMVDPTDPAEMASVYNGSSRTHRAFKAGNFAAVPEETKQYTDKLRRAIMELGGSAGAGRGTQGVAQAQALATPGAATPNASGTRTTSASYDPAAQSDFLNGILQYAGPGGQVDQSLADLQKAAADRVAANNELVAAISAAGAAKGEVAGAKAAAEAGEAIKRSLILDRMNLDPSRTNDEMGRAFSAINAADDALLPRKQEIDARMAVGFFDNPLEWLVNQTRLPGMVSEYNGIVGTRQDAISRYKDLASIASTQQSMSAATDADSILRVGSALKQQAAASAAEDAAKASESLAGAQIRDIQTMKGLAGQKLDLQLKALQLSKSITVDGVGGSGSSDAAAEKKFQEQQFDNVKRMIVAAGGTPPQNKLELRLASKRQLELMGEAARTGKFGSNFSDSFEFVWDTGNREKLARDGGAGVVTWIQGTAGEASKLVKVQADDAAKFKKTFDGKKALPDALNAMQARYEAEAATDMRGASQFNPLRLEYRSAAAAPELKNNALAIWLRQYGPGGAEETMREVDEGRILQKFAQSVTESKMTPATAAAQISEFYRVATAKQAQATSYPMFGINKPSKTYQVQFNDLGKDLTGVDLGDPAQVETAITRKIVADRAKAVWDTVKVTALNPVAGMAMQLQAHKDQLQQFDPLANLFGNKK